MNGKLSWSIFWALVGIYVVIACVLFIPAIRELLIGFLFLITSGTVFFLLGVALIVLTVKEKVGGMLKKFLILTGASAAGFFVGILLHNALYGLDIVTNDIAILSQSLEILQVVFFFLAIPVCPIGFLVGAVGSIVLAKKGIRMAK